MQPIESPNTLYNEMENIFHDIVSIHNHIVSVSNQLWYWLPDRENEQSLVQWTTTIRNEIIKIKLILSETKSRAENLATNVR